MIHYGYGMVLHGYLVVLFKAHKVYQVVLVQAVQVAHLVIQVQVDRAVQAVLMVYLV